MQPGPSANLPALPGTVVLQPNDEFSQPDSGPVGGLSATVGRHGEMQRKRSPKAQVSGLPSMLQAAVTLVQSLHHHRVVVQGGRVAGSN